MNADTPQPPESVEATPPHDLENDYITYCVSQRMFTREQGKAFLEGYVQTRAARAVAAAVKAKDEEIERLRQALNGLIEPEPKLYADVVGLVVQVDDLNAAKAALSAARAPARKGEGP